MNIFVLDSHPRLAAQYHCDKHVSKMILESAQMLCSVAHTLDVAAPYKPTHLHHPCTKWLAESQANLLWLWEMVEELNHECQVRYNHHRNHKSYDVFNLIAGDVFHALPKIEQTPSPLAMPKVYHSANAVDSYRQYYLKEKRPMVTYNYSNKPHWFV